MNILKKYWFLILALVSVVACYAKLQANVTAIDKRLTNAEAVVSEIPAIRTDVSWIVSYLKGELTPKTNKR